MDFRNFSFQSQEDNVLKAFKEKKLTQFNWIYWRYLESFSLTLLKLQYEINLVLSKLLTDPFIIINSSHRHQSESRGIVQATRRTFLLVRINKKKRFTMFRTADSSALLAIPNHNKITLAVHAIALLTNQRRGKWESIYEIFHPRLSAPWNSLRGGDGASSSKCWK